MSFTEKLKSAVLYSKKVREAAAQMWDAVERGYVFEVPFSLDRNDPAMQAVFLMQKLHPEVRIGVRQSRSLIISHPSRHAISAEVGELLLKGGQFYKPEEMTGTIEKMLAGHERFLMEQGLDPATMEAEAKEAEQKKHAIELRMTEPQFVGPVPDILGMNQPQVENDKPLESASEPANGG